MRKPFELIDMALGATTMTLDNVAKFCTKEGVQSEAFKTECAVVSILAVKVNVSSEHELVQKCAMDSLTALDFDHDNNGNAILDIEWKKFPQFIDLLEEYTDVEVISID